MTEPVDDLRWQRGTQPWRRGTAVFVGGVVGGGARLALSGMADSGSLVPWGTLLANLTGAFLLGYVLTRLLAATSGAGLTVPLLCTGLLGSYTTFSAFSLETWRLLESGHTVVGLGYSLGSVVSGLVLAAGGIRLAERRR